MEFSPKTFREALGEFPTGVAIATAYSTSGDPLGLTISSFNSVSLSPPLVLFSIGQSAKGYGEWMAVRHFAINVLHEGQSHLSSRFGRASPDKWVGIDHVINEHGVPVIKEALVVFECEVAARYDGGDHAIMLGRVLNFACSQDAGDPLVFCRGAYRKLSAPA